jgi:hypothetical protein
MDMVNSLMCDTPQPMHRTLPATVAQGAAIQWPESAYNSNKISFK